MKSAVKIFSTVVVFVLSLAMTNRVLAETVSNNSGNENFVLTEIDTNNSSNASEWNLAYPDADSHIKIEKLIRKNSIEYIVRSEFFEVRYVNGKNGFGARTIRPTQATTPLSMNTIILSEKELANQKIIVPNTIDDQTAIGLIGSYLPNLLNDNYKNIL